MQTTIHGAPTGLEWIPHTDPSWGNPSHSGVRQESWFPRSVSSVVPAPQLSAAFLTRSPLRYHLSHLGLRLVILPHMRKLDTPETGQSPWCLMSSPGGGPGGGTPAPRRQSLPAAPWVTPAPPIRARQASAGAPPSAAAPGGVSCLQGDTRGVSPGCQEHPLPPGLLSAGAPPQRGERRARRSRVTGTSAESPGGAGRRERGRRGGRASCAPPAPARRGGSGGRHGSGNRGPSAPGPAAAAARRSRAAHAAGTGRLLRVKAPAPSLALSFPPLPLRFPPLGACGRWRLRGASRCHRRGGRTGLSKMFQQRAQNQIWEGDKMGTPVAPRGACFCS